MALPGTRTRLKGFMTLRTVRGGVELADKDSPLNLNGLMIVGASRKLTIDQKRGDNNFRREFGNTADAAKPAETYPGLVSYTIHIDRVDLYDANLQEAFGFVGSNIVQQLRPIVIVAEQPVPMAADGITPLSIQGRPFLIRSLIIPGCWFDNLQIEYDIDDQDQKFVLGVDMIARDVISEN